MTVVKLANFSDAAQRTLAIPVPYTSSAWVVCGSTTFYQLLSSGVAQNINVWSALALAGGSSTAQTNLNQRSIGDINVAFDTVLINLGSARTGTLLIVGF